MATNARIDTQSAYGRFSAIARRIPYESYKGRSCAILRGDFYEYRQKTGGTDRSDLPGCGDPGRMAVQPAPGYTESQNSHPGGDPQHTNPGEETECEQGGSS